MAERIMLTVIVDLDPSPGVFNTPESAKQVIEVALLNRIGHYHPVVLLHEE